MNPKPIEKTQSFEDIHKTFITSIKITVLVFWIILFACGVSVYPGTKTIYTVFSFAFGLMLISGFYKPVSYSYLFMVVFLWLGFWLKLTGHLILNYPFIEPVGNFYGQDLAYHIVRYIKPVSYLKGNYLDFDKILIIATIASAGVIISRTLYGLFYSEMIPHNQLDSQKIPLCYRNNRKTVWSILLILIAAMNVINIVYSIQQAGLVPRSILAWPLNSLIAWTVSIGSAMGIATLLWWDISLKKNISLTIYTVFIEAFISTISLFSRAVYIFHVIPLMFPLYKNRKILTGISYRKAIIMLVVFVCLFILSFSCVNELREKYYSEVTSIQIYKNRNILETTPKTTSGSIIYFLKDKGYRIGFIIKLISDLTIDRWIGVEGLMAVQSYPQKGKSKIKEALFEKREIGKITLYQKVCNSHYQYMDNNKTQFASLPGAVAFLYYSGSIWVVMLGMMVLTLIIIFAENLVLRLTSNPLLCSLIGLCMANTVAQFGLTPRQDIPYYLMIFIALTAIWFIQSGLYIGILRNFGMLVKKNDNE
jgi:hypothetical protein